MKQYLALRYAMLLTDWTTSPISSISSGHAYFTIFPAFVQGDCEHPSTLLIKLFFCKFIISKLEANYFAKKDQTKVILYPKRKPTKISKIS
jgi:hypothetical protein